MWERQSGLHFETFLERITRARAQVSVKDLPKTFRPNGINSYHNIIRYVTVKSISEISYASFRVNVGTNNWRRYKPNCKIIFCTN